MSQELFLASTPLHVLNSVAIASKTPDKSSCLWLIDQPDVTENPYFEVLQSWPDSPFKEVRISQGHIKGTRAKLQNRKKVFADIQSWVDRYQPDRVYTGNDRRIEFQYAMHCASQQKKPISAAYMDEGTFTYVGRKASGSFADSVVDNTLKKLTYGFWWKNPPTIGGSAWIDDVYAAFPDLIHPLLKQKQVLDLQSVYEGNSCVKSFCSYLYERLSGTVGNISGIQCVLTLPHESIIDRITGYKDAIQEVVKQLQYSGLEVGVKYHPRNNNPDILDVKNIKGFHLLPYKVPFEAILPLLPPDVLVIGDVSSTLINSRWLKPGARLISVANDEAPMYNEFAQLFSKIDVALTDAAQLVQLLSSLFETEK